MSSYALGKSDGVVRPQDTQVIAVVNVRILSHITLASQLLTQLVVGHCFLSWDIVPLEELNRLYVVLGVIAQTLCSRFTLVLCCSQSPIVLLLLLSAIHTKVTVADTFGVVVVRVVLPGPATRAQTLTG